MVVPHTKRSYFLNKIEDYAKNNTKSGKPSNQRLVDSISQIREAVLESFWRGDEFSRVLEAKPIWVEVWLLGETDASAQRFTDIAREIGIAIAEGVLTFPERTVRLIRADRNQLTRLVASSDDIAEFR